jgi:hypothetical protein
MVSSHGGKYTVTCLFGAVPSHATIRADMETYTLTSKARPRVGLGQATCLYSVMEELGGGPVTLDQIVEKCEYRR